MDCVCHEHGRCRNQPQAGETSSLPNSGPVSCPKTTSSKLSSSLPSFPSSSSSTVELTSRMHAVSQVQTLQNSTQISQVQAGVRTPQATISRCSSTEANEVCVSNIAPGSADLNDCAIDREIGQLPLFPPASDPNCRWGDVEGASLAQTVSVAYSQVVHWRRNVFLVPSGAEGKEFVSEMARLYQSYADGSAMEGFAITAAMIMPALLLQKPHPHSKARDHVKCLKRRMTAWKQGDINGLLRECQSIQQHLSTDSRPANNHDGVLRGFTKLMLLGNVRGALRVLSQAPSGGVLSLESRIDLDGEERSVRDILKDKHPRAEEVLARAVVDENYKGSPSFHPVLFEKITAASVRNAALRTEGSAGPSGIDATGWRRLCTSFHGASNTLCTALAAVARRISTEYVDPSPLHAFIACRLIPLDKNPGVRPIGVCEIVRRIIGKLVVNVLSHDIRVAAGPLQVCAGQPAGSEAAIHAIADVLMDAGSDGVLFVDASNAFNRLNRQVALRNIRTICPTLARFLINIYRADASLFVGGDTLYSTEGTTQGDPLAMAMFAIAVRPLVDRLMIAQTTQVWFADDASSGGAVFSLRKWWDLLVEHGPSFGYYPNAVKTYLLVKPESALDAQRAFEGTEVNITTSGVRYLGAPLGDVDFTKSYIAAKVDGWKAELVKLAEIARVQPHLAFCALTQGLVSRWTYLSRTVKDIDALLQPLEEILQKDVLPALTGRSAPDEVVRALFALPARLGGIGIPVPSENGALHNLISREVTRPTVRLILDQNVRDISDRLDESLAEQRLVISRMRKLRTEVENSRQTDLSSRLSSSLQLSVMLSKDKGASSWLGARPVQEHGFSLHKGAFRDALALRYGWEPPNLPSHCACGSAFDSTHALSCAKGGFTIVRHDEIRNLTASLMHEVCHDVEIEPKLQSLSGEQLDQASGNSNPDARLDIKARGLWGGAFECAFFDVRVFNPRAHSNTAQSMASVYRRHEQSKRRQYDQRVRDVEMASFTPLVFSASGGFGPASDTTFKRLASSLACKWDMPYSAVMGWLRCRTSFALLRSSVMCLRGSRVHVRGGVTRPELAIAEGRL